MANLFLHYAFDEWMRRNYPKIPFERYADDVIAHCKSVEEAEKIRDAIEKRLAHCKLELHPEKTKIVYCKDGQRKEGYHNEKFDFLGFTFQPRQSKSRQGNLFLGFNPAVSTKAAESIRRTIRSWKIHRRSQMSIEDIAEKINPIMSGWINYYGSYNKSKLSSILGQFDYALFRWAQKKYKKLRGSQKKARNWVKRIAKQNPRLFVHWRITLQPTAGQ